MPVTTIQIRRPDIFRFHIAPGTENQIAVTPTLMSTSSNAMSRSTLQRIFAEMEKYLSFPSSLTTGMILTRFNSEQRDCYNEDEIALKFLPRDHGYRCCVVPLCHCAIMPLCHRCAIGNISSPFSSRWRSWWNLPTSCWLSSPPWSTARSSRSPA